MAITKTNKVRGEYNEEYRLFWEAYKEAAKKAGNRATKRDFESKKVIKQLLSDKQKAVEQVGREEKELREGFKKFKRARKEVGESVSMSDFEQTPLYKRIKRRNYQREYRLKRRVTERQYILVDPDSPLRPPRLPDDEGIDLPGGVKMIHFIKRQPYHSVLGYSDGKGSRIIRDKYKTASKKQKIGLSTYETINGFEQKVGGPVYSMPQADEKLRELYILGLKIQDETGNSLVPVDGFQYSFPNGDVNFKIVIWGDDVVPNYYKTN